MSGTTSSTDFPTVNAVQPTPKGGFDDIFVAKLTPDGTALVYATYLGGSDYETLGRYRWSIPPALRTLVRHTCSADFPTVHAFQPARKGDGWDAVVAKLSADGSRIIYSTYLGGSDS